MRRLLAEHSTNILRRPADETLCTHLAPVIEAWKKPRKRFRFPPPPNRLNKEREAIVASSRRKAKFVDHETLLLVDIKGKRSAPFHV